MKKIMMPSEDLIKALKKLNAAVDSNAVIPAMKNIYVKAEASEVELVTTSIELTISYKCGAQVEGAPFELLVPFDFLNKICHLAGSASITIEHPSTRKARIIVADLLDNEVYDLGSLDKLEEYPKIPTVPKKNIVKLPEGFVDLLEKAMLTVGKDEHRPAMTRACLDINGENSYLVSTDAHFMYRHKIALESTDPQQLSFSHRVASAMAGLTHIEVSWNEKLMAIRSGQLIIWAKRHEGKYPNYNAVIPDFAANLHLETDKLVQALKKACLTSSAAKQTSLLLTRKAGELHLEADDPDFSRKINLVIPGQYEGTVDQVRLNAKKLLTVLDQADCEKVSLAIHSPNMAVLVSTQEDKDYLGLVMPLVNEQ